jgi:hypothetical protein
MREAEEGEREDRKKEGNGLRDLGWRDWAGERKQPEHMMPSACTTHSPIRAFEFQPRVFMRSGRVWWEKTKNMAS